jgi:hypothetical protein
MQRKWYKPIINLKADKSQPLNLLVKNYKLSLERDFKGGNLKSLEMRFILEEGFLGM